jgi:hypothetical protein
MKMKIVLFIQFLKLVMPRNTCGDLLAYIFLMWSDDMSVDISDVANI